MSSNDESLRLEKLADDLPPPDDAKLRYCWELVKRAIAYHLLYSAEIDDLVGCLQHRQNYSSDEILFEYIGGHLQVSFLDETVACSGVGMIALLQQLQEHFANQRASAYGA